MVTIVKRSKFRWYNHLLRNNEGEVVRQAWKELMKWKMSGALQLEGWQDGLKERYVELGPKEQDAQHRQE